MILNHLKHIIPTYSLIPIIVDNEIQHKKLYCWQTQTPTQTQIQTQTILK